MIITETRVKGKKLIKVGYTVDEIPTAINTKANTIIRDYLKLAYASLRILGGHAEHPLYKVAAVGSTHHRYHWRYNADSLVIQTKRGPRVVTDAKILEALLNKRVDEDSLGMTVMTSVWGDSAWKNVCNRVKARLKPVLIRHLLEAKMEASDDRGSAGNDNQDMVVQSTQ